ncbi:LysR family transcriptional regulator [Cellvibrio sp. PSBB006]|uniref:LysR family transcriptional regulator n=1 Tax=Cellvibrio sp. PSBB006 TaxID=1987723 RepID=UPI000B3B17C8|nr:LysR family transcriptional regulator [Cellvibrio sp. PSBB006]ARU29384.1 hypothetical protein CBR65_19160 [Cellvibrio sp. PSBB006]
MDIELLKTFIEVTQVRHFGRAADNLFLTPAAVSARIRQLEQMLGVTLLHRIRGNIQMTAEGERLLPHAQKLLHAWSETLEDLSIKLEPENHLTLGTTASVWQCELSDLIQELLTLSAGRGLSIESLSHLELITQILAQRLDLALVLDLPQHPELHAIKIAEQELTLCSSAESPLSTTPYLLIEWSAAFTAFHHKRVAGVEPRLRTTEAALAVKFMQQVPASAYLPAANHGFYPVSDAPRFVQPVYLVYKAGREFEAALAPVLALFK